MMTASLLNLLLHAAEASAPREMCGLLFGDTYAPMVNIAADPLHAFEIATEEYMKACMVHDGKPWAIVHSHPNSPAVLSVRDCRLMDALEMANHEVEMIVVSLSPREIRSFRKRGHVYKRIWEHVA